MGLFGGNIVIILILRNSLKILGSKIDDEFVYPKEAVLNQDVIDDNLFEKNLASFFGNYHKTDAYILLSDEVVFSKILPSSSLTNLQNEAESFFAKSPFDRNVLGKKIVNIKGKIFLLSTNIHIYESVKDSLEKRGFRVHGVFPLPVYESINKISDLSYGSLKKVVRNKNLLVLTNFLTKNKFDHLLSESVHEEITTSESEEDEKTVSANSKTLLMTIIFFVLLIILVGGGFYVFFTRNMNKQTSNENISESQASPTQLQPTKEPTKVVEEKIPPQITKAEDVRIQILNGSSIAGQATQIKDALEAVGFVNIETGNAEETIEQTTVTISPDVSEELASLIINELEKIFSSVASSSSEIEVDFDVLIVTGSNTK